jgi:hypothetical protein
MRRVLRIGSRVLLVVLVVILIALPVLLGSPSIPEQSDYQLEIGMGW